MDGVFMLKFQKFALLLAVFAALVLGSDLITDRFQLHDSLIRLHVVGASDEDRDQWVKLRVRDAVNDWLQDRMEDIETVEDARTYLDDHLVELEAVANEALEQYGMADRAAVSFLEEEFPARHYETFSLPSGVYYSLRIRIGEAQGKNWWCVVFPTLCLGATREEFRDTAVSAGFEKDLSGALAGDDGYEIRFFLLDCLGMLQNFFHRS